MESEFMPTTSALLEPPLLNTMLQKVPLCLDSECDTVQ